VAVDRRAVNRRAVNMSEERRASYHDGDLELLGALKRLVETE
jgi:hypothetical protein